MRLFSRILLLICCLSSIVAHAAKTQVSLSLSAQTAKPGDTITAGIKLQMLPEWHTYWRNPGDSGISTKISWTLPPTLTAGEIQWPVPEKVVVGEGEFRQVTYGYNNEVVLLV